MSERSPKFTFGSSAENPSQQGISKAPEQTQSSGEVPSITRLLNRKTLMNPGPETEATQAIPPSPIGNHTTGLVRRRKLSPVPPAQPPIPAPPSTGTLHSTLSGPTLEVRKKKRTPSPTSADGPILSGPESSVLSHFFVQYTHAVHWTLFRKAPATNEWKIATHGAHPKEDSTLSSRLAVANGWASHHPQLNAHFLQYSRTPLHSLPRELPQLTLLQKTLGDFPHGEFTWIGNLGKKGETEQVLLLNHPPYPSMEELRNLTEKLRVELQKSTEELKLAEEDVPLAA